MGEATADASGQTEPQDAVPHGDALRQGTEPPCDPSHSRAQLDALDLTELQLAVTATAERLWRQYAWTGLARSSFGVFGVLLAAWTTEIRAHECTPFVGCYSAEHSLGSDELARISILLLFVFGALLELLCLLAPADERWRASSKAVVKLNSLTWTWAMAAEDADAIAQPGGYAEAYADATRKCVSSATVGPFFEVPSVCLDPTAGIGQLREKPPLERWSYYCETRLGAKEKEYRRFIHHANRAANRLRILLVLLYVAGIVFAALSLLHRDLDIGILGVVSTFLTGRAAALAARHPIGSAHAYKEAADSLNLQRLKLIHWDRIDSAGAEKHVRDLVCIAEQHITQLPPRPGSLLPRLARTTRPAVAPWPGSAEPGRPGARNNESQDLVADSATRQG
jgi:hypothetical protein